MALDPRISLAAQAPTPVGDIFRGILQNIGEAQRQKIVSEQAPIQNRLLELEAELSEAQQPALLQRAQQASSPVAQALGQSTQQNQLDIVNAQALKPFLDSGDKLGAITQLTKQKQQAIDLGLDQSEVDEVDQAIALLNQEGGMEKAKSFTDSFLNVTGTTPFQQKASVKSFAPITDPETGKVSIPTFDPNTQETTLVEVEGARQLTPQQKQEQELKSFTTKEARKAKISRAKEIKKDLGDRNRSASRSQQPLFEALRLASNPRTREGISAGVTTQLARLLPGIDVGNEANLDSALNRLALEQLQNFKGPTTDFEFGVTQDITGSITDPREANIARLKSLQRANWFAKREFKQFNDFIEGGGDPDNFSFDFNETVSTNKGEFSLQDIQETAVDNRMTIEEVLAELDK